MAAPTKISREACKARESYAAGLEPLHGAILSETVTVELERQSPKSKVAKNKTPVKENLELCI